KVMDAFGRLWIGIPAMLTMGLAMALLPLTTTVAAFAWVAVLLGLGNGMSSGILMTLGADVAPPGERAQFLGIWRVFQDGGAAAGPLVVSAGAALGSLAAGIWVMAGSGVVAAGALGRWVPRWAAHANRTTRRPAGLRGLRPATRRSRPSAGRPGRPRGPRRRARPAPPSPAGRSSGRPTARRCPVPPRDAAAGR